MTATPNFASGPATGAETGDPAAPAAAGPFVLNLCSSTTPMALAQTDLPELRRFTFFVSRRFEEGRERFRLHMGYFATLAEAEELLGVVREIYPGAWAGEAPGRKLRERAVAAAAAQAQHAAGPQPRAAAAPRTSAYAVTPLPAAHPPGMRVPVVHAAPAGALRAAPPVLAPAGMRPAGRQVSAPPPKPVLDINTAPPPPRGAPNPLLDINTAPPPRGVPAKPVLDITTAPVPPPRKAPPAPAARAAASPAAARAGKSGVKPVFEDSNVREVLKALGDASATGETRLMRTPPPPRPAAPARGSLSDTQVLKLLETRRPEGGGPAAADTDGGAIPMLKPDDTGTRLALKDAVANNAPVSFAVQLQWSVQPAELDKVPPLAIFSAYTLYTVEGSRDGRRWYGLRLGFFSDAISAKQVAHYVRSEFASVAVVPVSAQEKARATDQDAAAHIGPVAARRNPTDEFKLTDDGARKAAAASPAPAAAAASAAASTPPPRATAAAKPAPAPKVAVGRALSQPAAPPAARPSGRGRVGARDNRGPQTLEETLEILGASQLSIDNGTGETLNESGVRHLRVQVQKNSPFSRLLERLSERLRKT
jgi:hypothetical protein